MSPTVRGAAVLGLAALSGLILPPAFAVLALLAVAAAIATDAYAGRRPPAVVRAAPATLSRGVRVPLRLSAPGESRTLRLRQPRPPDVSVEPAEADGVLETEIVGLRRGRHVLPAAAARVTGPLGLGSWTHRQGEPHELVVYPDLPTARRLALAVRTGRFRDEGRRSRGPLGLGTDFESIRDYSPDDDVRQLNWRATERLGRPMSNTYRVERDRDVVCVVDCGRLMASPLGDLTRLDAAVDAAVSVAAVADAVGDRAGALAFDREILRSLSPRRAGGAAVVQALFDLEPRPVDSDYELAFRHVGETKRAFVLVLTDLLDETAARPLAAALPLLARRHALAVASATDVDLERLLTDEPERVEEVYRAAAAAEVLAARSRVVARLRHAGALVIEAPAGALPAACVSAYLRAKARARL
jgi:uncharacterized protein (DUF58 family)